MYKYLLFTALGLVSLSLSAQQFLDPDTLVLNMPANGMIKLLAYHPDQLKKPLEIDSLIAQFNRDWEGFQPDTYDPSLPTRIDYQISANGQRKIRLYQDRTVTHSALISANGQVQPGKVSPDQVWIDLPNPQLDMYWEVDYLADIEGWESVILNRRLAQIQEDLQIFKNIRTLNINRKIIYDHQGPVESVPPKKPAKVGRTPYLQLSPVWGAGLIRNTLVLDLGTSITLVFPHHRRKRYWAVGTNLSSHFFFENTSDGKFNPMEQIFISAFYRSINLDKSLGSGISLGILVSKEGSYFEDNTVKIGFPILLGKTALNVTPEVYFPGKLEGAFPGLRLSWGF